MADKIDLSVLGTTGLKQSNGEILEDDDVLLRGSKGIKTYTAMANSSVLGSALFIIETLIKQCEWKIEPAIETADAQAQADFVTECLSDMSHTWGDFLDEVLEFLIYGWAYFEVCLKLRKGDTKDPTTRSKFNDGKIGWRKFSGRAQDTLERWEFDEDGGLRGFNQMDGYSGVRAFIPIEKSILFRTKSVHDNPEGRSILRKAVADWRFLKKICTIEAIGVERDLSGLPTMEVPERLLHVNASSADKTLLTMLQRMLGEIKNDERAYAIVPAETDENGKPSGYKLKLLATGGGRSFNTTEIKNWYKINMLQAVFAHFIQLGMGDSGSFALSTNITALFTQALNNFMDKICETFNRFAVDRLMKANGVAEELHPALVHGRIEKDKLEILGAYIQALSASGQLPINEPALQKRLLEAANLPVPAEID